MAEGMQEKSVVLLAMDGGPHAKFAMDYYLKYLHKDEDELVIFHSVEPVVPMSQSSYVSGEVWRDLMEQERAKIRHLEKECAALLEGTGVTWRFSAVMGGRPGEMICRTAAEVKATLIVIGTRGLSTLRRTILGSVSDFVLHHVHCPVCICRQ